MNNQNPFRFATAKENKAKWIELRISDACLASMSVAASAFHVATKYGEAGAVAVLPISAANYKPTNNPGQVVAGGGLGDLQWSPFDDTVLATGSTCGLVKVWKIPETGFADTSSTPTATINDLGCVHALQWHPSASEILAVGCKNNVTVIDTAAGSAVYKFEATGFNKDTLSIAWSPDGSQLACVGKSDFLFVFDPRTAASDILTTEGTVKLTMKAQHVLFLDKDRVLVLGLDSSRKPKAALYSLKDMSKPVFDTWLDFSSGQLLPMYDSDAELLYLCMRGSGMLAIFDMSLKGAVKGMTQIHASSSGSNYLGACLLPKFALDHNKHEIDRVIKMTTNSLEQLNVSVPRKSTSMEKDLFPPTNSRTPAHDGTSYLAGNDKMPLKCQANTVLAAAKPIAAPSAASSSSSSSSYSKPTPAPVSVKAASPSPSSTTSASPVTRGFGGLNVSSPTSPSSPKDTSVLTSFGKSDVRKQFEVKNARSCYANIVGQEPSLFSKEKYHYDLSLGQTMSMCENIQGNSAFFAVPWKAAGGGVLAVFTLNSYGRVAASIPVIRAHKSQVTAFQFNPFNETELLSGSGEGVLMKWKIPVNGLTEDITEPVQQLEDGGAIKTIQFHPLVSNVLASSSSSYDGHKLRLWDLKTGKCEITIEHPDSVEDISFDYRAVLMATACKDKKCRIIDPRKNKILSEFECEQNVRDTRVIWIDDKRVLTVGFAKGSTRSMSLWTDLESGSPKCLETKEIDRGTSTLIVRFDPDMQLLFCAGNGERSFFFFHLYPDMDNAVKSHFERCVDWSSNSDLRGFVFLPKNTLDIAAVEMAKVVKLTKDTMIPCTFRVPRKRLEYFQDDLYPPALPFTPVMDSGEWFANQNKAVVRVSLCPAGMGLLSTAPPEELTKNQLKYVNHLESQNKPKAVGLLGHASNEEVKAHFQHVAANVMPTSNRWDAKVDDSQKDVDDDAWD